MDALDFVLVYIDLIVVGLLFVFIFLLIVLYVLIVKIQTKIKYFETGIDKIYKEIQNIKSWASNSQQIIDDNVNKINSRLNNEFEIRVRDVIDVELAKITHEIDVLESKIKEEKYFINDRLDILESKTKTQ